MGQEEDRGSGKGIVDRWLSRVVLLVILLIALGACYLLVDTILRLRNPATDLGRAVGTQVQQALNPTPTIIASPATIIRQVQALGRLETVSYTIEKVITAESGQGAFAFLLGDRLLLVAHGQVIAGVDMSLMQQSNVQVEGETVHLTLPAAEIFVATLDNEKTYVYSRETGPFGLQKNLESQARQAAQEAILQAAIEDGILQLAQTNAEVFITKLLYTLGFKEVLLMQGTPAPGQNLGTDSAP